MADYRRIYPNKDRLIFDGGLNNKFERSIIALNESPDCANVVFTNGAVETRQGSSKLNATAIASTVVDGLYTRKTSSGGETMIAFTNAGAYQLAGSTFSPIPSAVCAFTAGIRVAATQYENHMFIGNGGVVPYKYNGTDFTRHGVYPPTTTASVASNGVGSLDASADYLYKVTFVNSQLVESDVGPVSTTFTISTTSGQNRISSIPVAPQSWGVGSRRLYRTEGGGSTFKRVVTISDNTTTTYDDNIPDASLGTTAPTDNGVPPLYSVIVYHQNRLFMNDPSNPNFVWYTELGEPYTVKATNFLSIADATGDTVKTLSVYENGVIVGCVNSHWMIYMPDTDPTNWVVLKIDTSYGSKSPFGYANYNNAVLLPAMQNDKFVGFAELRGGAVSPSATFLTVSTTGSDLKSERIEPEMFDVVESLVGNISSITYKNKVYIALTQESGNTMNNKIWVMDFSASNLNKKQTESWVPWTGLRAAQFTIYNGNLYYGSSIADGFIYQLETGTYSDAGSAIDSYFWTKEFSGFENEENFQKDFRYANLLVEKSGSYYMNLLYRVDSDTGDGTSVLVDLNPGGSQWGSMTWGTDVWGGGTAQEDKKVYLGTARGKRIQYKFTNQNTANQRFKVHGMKFAYNLRGYR